MSLLCDGPGEPGGRQQEDTGRAGDVTVLRWMGSTVGRRHLTEVEYSATHLHPNRHLVAHTETGTPIGPLRDRITGYVLPRIRQALELDTLSADLLLQLDTSTSSCIR